MKNQKLVILDGTSILAEAYYKSLTLEIENAITDEEKEKAFNSLLKSKKGEYINAVQGFFKLFLDVLDKQKPEYFAVVWGAPRKTNFRKLEIYSGYKNDGKEMDEPLKEQTKTVKNILSNLGVNQYSSDKYEALDLAGSIANKFKDNLDVYILARNSLSLQLADISKVWFKVPNFKELAEEFEMDIKNIPRGCIELDSLGVEMIKGVSPYQIKDYYALKGNHLIGIPGVRDVGEKSILPLIEEYEDIESIYDEIENLDEKGRFELFSSLRKYHGIHYNPIPFLLKDKDKAFISKELVTIKRDVLIDNLEELTSSKLEIDKVALVKELKNFNLTPVEGRVTKKVLSEIDTTPTYRGLLKTYNPFILSPLSDTYIGSNISEISESDNERFELPVFNISNDWNNPIKTLSNENKEVLNKEDSIAVSIESNTEIEDTKEELQSGLCLVETEIFRTYLCNTCKSKFTVKNDEARFCIHCGAKQSVNTNKEDKSKEEDNNIEKSSNIDTKNIDIQLSLLG